MVGSRGQEGRDKACGDQVPFLGALVALVLSLILILIAPRPTLGLASGASCGVCGSVCAHKCEWGKEPGDESGS